MTVHRYDEISARFAPVFARIAEGAVERENGRVLAHDAVAQLRDAGFGAVRVPTEFGGLGGSVTDLFRLLIDLGAADSNLPQALRAHFGTTEERLHDTDSPRRTKWLERVAKGAIVGNATTETGGGVAGVVATTVTEGADGTWRIAGTKHYSTGSLYADWIAVLARREGTESEIGFALVPSDAGGVERVDDWDGFGQKLTASGTTVLRDVVVDPEDVFWYAERRPNYQIAFFQLFHLATLSGIARAVERDAVAYVQTRKRVFTHGSGETPAGDPLVQAVVGRLAAAAFAAEATTLAAVARLEGINTLRADGEVPAEAFDAAEIATSQAQITVVPTVLAAATELFEVGGASTVQAGRALDRHWRNARVLAVHNPVVYKQRVVGDHRLNGTEPAYSWMVGVKS